jgi:hypothetical protein
MAQLGKLYGTVQDSRGNPISGATVEVRTQGAFVTSTQAGPAYTVDDPGGIVSGTSQVCANLLSVPQRNVSAVAATTVTTGGAGLGTLNNNDRITVVNPLPTVYADAFGNETKANPLTTDANGFWFCYAPKAPYDVKTSGTNYGSRLEPDKSTDGGEYALSNQFPAAGAAAFRRTTSRTLTAGYIQTWENPSGSIKASIDYLGNGVLTGGLASSGNISGINGTFAGTLGATGATTLGAALGVTGLSSLTGGATVGTSFTYSGVKASFSLTAGSIETADLDLNAASATFVGSGTTDQALVAAAAYADVVSATVTFTPFSSASEIEVMAVIPGEGAGAGNYLLFARIVDGTAATIYHEAAANQAAAGTANAPMTLTCIARLTGLTGAQTFKVQAKCTTTNVNLLSNSTDRKTRIVVVEHKR